MEVVDDEIAGIELVHGRAETRVLGGAGQPFGDHAAARPVLLGRVPRVGPDVVVVHAETLRHIPDIFCRVSSKRAGKSSRLAVAATPDTRTVDRGRAGRAARGL